MAGSSYEVVIIGGSFGGLTAAHYLLQTIIPSLSSTKKDYKVTILTNSSKFFHKISAPRTLIQPQLQALEVGLVDIAPGFKKYGEKFQLVLGYATQVDSTAKTIGYIGTEGNASGSLKYDSLIIASGVSMDSLWSVSDGWEKVEAAHKEIQSKLVNAKTVLIAGGGPVGVETTGEIAARFPHQKDVTLLSGGSRLLASIHNTAFGKDAENKLKKYGVKVVHGVRATSWDKQADGSTIVSLDNGETKTVDVFIPATGTKTNSSFVPPSWISTTQTNGTIKTDPHTLRLNVPNVEDIYVFGAVGDYSDGTVIDVNFGYKVLGESFKVDQLKSTGAAPKQKLLYKKFNNGDMGVVPLGPKDGLMIVKGFRLPSFLAVMVKSKDYFASKVSMTSEGKGL